ncbi:hypothetical protein CAPTEDRAFT_224998 [Capitella teleta]|uniref:Uncharacterized protein n=1 Tax=Capitella teleta TaxID=283909 RepID=R7V730_CAPTE|nr:hypothetical protein CAPTEDRAFT_224998 [Capitella teleta]|eukprot:ELU12161.1 hypothetical protein CAPTEDRAFT_224998 [Capitella teleta]
MDENKIAVQSGPKVVYLLQLCDLIGKRDLTAIKGLLHSISSYSDVEAVVSAFKPKDPVVYAIEKGDESIVIYLVEKGFPTNLLYKPDPDPCDRWCKQQHGSDQCPALYDALSLSRGSQLTRASQLIMEIRDGTRNPGDGLTEKRAMKTKTTSAQLHNGDVSQDGFKTSARKAKDRIAQVGLNYIDSKEGETALHLAIRSNDLQPGLLKALQNSNARAVQRLLSMWCCTESNIKNGLPALDIATQLKDKSPEAQKCLKLIQNNRSRLQLVHAVLSEDVNTLQKLLKSDRVQQMINTRYGSQGRSGATLLSQAIEQGSLDVVKILIKTGKCNLSMRVSECMTDKNSPTVPLYFKSLSKDCPTEVWRFVSKYVDLTEDFEKDKDGNTPVLRAIKNVKSLEFMTALFRGLNFNRLLSRNEKGQTARELAAELGRTDIIELIDKKILSFCGQGMYHMFPVTFQKRRSVSTITDRAGRNLLELSCDVETGNEIDKQALKHWAAIERLGRQLFQASAEGNIGSIEQLNASDYTDRNGFTALTRAVVFNQPAVAKELLVHRPELRMIGDNLNRYPLHYAFSLSEEQSKQMVAVILSNAQQGIEHRRDKDGREPAEYMALRDTPLVLKMLHDARTLDAYGKPGEPMGPLPDGAIIPPFAE